MVKMWDDLPYEIVDKIMLERWYLMLKHKYRRVGGYMITWRKDGRKWARWT